MQKRLEEYEELAVKLSPVVKAMADVVNAELEQAVAS
jgi:hypothetical protein